MIPELVFTISGIPNCTHVDTSFRKMDRIFSCTATQVEHTASGFKESIHHVPCPSPDFEGKGIRRKPSVVLESVQIECIPYMGVQPSLFRPFIRHCYLRRMIRGKDAIRCPARRAFSACRLRRGPGQTGILSCAKPTL